MSTCDFYIVLRIIDNTVQTYSFSARSEVGLLIQHHTLLAEVPIDLLPYSLSHTIPTRSKIFSTSCCPLPSSNRPRHYWVSYHTGLLNPLFHLKFPFFISFVQTLCVQSFILCCTSHSTLLLFSLFVIQYGRPYCIIYVRILDWSSCFRTIY